MVSHSAADCVAGESPHRWELCFKSKQEVWKKKGGGLDMCEDSTLRPEETGFEIQELPLEDKKNEDPCQDSSRQKFNLSPLFVVLSP